MQNTILSGKRTAISPANIDTTTDKISLVMMC
jgi:hypothetical protein